MIQDYSTLMFDNFRSKSMINGHDIYSNLWQFVIYDSYGKSKIITHL